MATLIEQESGKEIKLKRNNHVDEEIEIDLMQPIMVNSRMK